MLEALIEVGLLAGLILQFFIYLKVKEDKKSLETELRQIVHDHDIDSRQLRRSMRVRSFRKWYIKQQEKELKESLEEADLSDE